MSRAALDAIYLSAHLDDAVLSCGGQIHRRVRDGQRVAILTLFAGDEPAAPPSPFAARLHRRWGLPSPVVAARRAEDQEAAARLGAVARHGPWREALYRVDPASGAALYPDGAALFSPPHREEAGLAAELARWLAAEIAGSAAVIAPLAAGGHVDHRLVRAAAAAVAVSGLRFYEDQPYALRPFAAWWARRGARSWRSETVALEPADLDAKIDAAACYRSQVGPLFGDRQAMADRLRQASRRAGGERLWLLSAGPLVAAGQSR